MPEFAKQHFVSQSYLKAWMDPDTPEGQAGYVWLFPKEGGVGRRKSPKKIFRETDIYTIKLSGGERDVWIEKSLSVIEGMFTAVRDGPISRRERLTDDDRATLCVFVAAMIFRSRKSRDHHRGQFQKVLDLGEKIRARMRAKQKELGPVEYQKYSKSMAPLMPGNRAASLSMEEIQKLADEPLQNVMWPFIQAYSSQMYEMNLTFIVAADDLGFITSDSPAFIRKPGIDDLPLNVRPPGLLWEWTEVLMPVAPNVLAAFSWQQATDWGRATADQQDDLNQMIRWYAEKEIVVRRNESRPHWFTNEPRILG